MDSPETADNPSETISDNNVSKTPEREFSVERIQAMVTPEQEFSASVAKKRRSYTKKRSSMHKTREQTPVRYVSDEKSSSDEDVPKVRPKTPERKRRKLRRSINKSDVGSKSEPEFNNETRKDRNNDVRKSKSVPRQLPPSDMLLANGDNAETQSLVSSVPSQEDKPRKNSLIDLAQMAQDEVKAFFDKTKKQLTETSFYNTTKKQLTDAAKRGREKLRKSKEKVKRSQSAPYEFTEEELIESFRKAQLINGIYSDLPKRNSVDSDATLDSLDASEERAVRPKPFRPEVQEFVRQRKKQKQYSNKIIEILDPVDTSKILATRVIKQKPEYRIRELFAILRMYSIREIFKQYRAYKKERIKEYDVIRNLRKRCVNELILIMIYCGFGGLAFKFIEGGFENFYKCGVKKVKRDFIDQLWLRSHNLREEDWKSLARNKLWNFEEELHTAHEAGMKTYSGQSSWSFLNGIVYCMTVITTIGYGHIYPSTFTGKVLTIIYSIIGIPLFLIILTDFGKLFTRCIKFLWSFVRRLYYTGSCRRARKTAHVKEIFKGAQFMYEIATFRRPSVFNDPEVPATATTDTVVGEDTPTTPAISNFEIDDEFNLPISLAIFILLLYIFLGATIYSVVTHWNFFDAFYFVFISMSTIGFGDIVPNNPLIMIVSIVYLAFGLALTSMCINVVQDKLSDTFKQASAKIGATIGLKVSEDDGSISTVPPELVEVPSVHTGSIKDEKLGAPAGNGQASMQTLVVPSFEPETKGKSSQPCALGFESIQDTSKHQS